MTRLLELLKDLPELTFEPNEVIIREDRPMTRLYVLIDGEVEISADHNLVCRVSRKGSAFGEVSALLGINPTATVRVTKPSRFRVAEDSVALLSGNIEVTLEIARLLAHRVKRLTFNYVEEMDDGESVFWRGR